MAAHAFRPVLALAASAVLAATAFIGGSEAFADTPTWVNTSSTTSADGVTVTWDTASTSITPFSGLSLISPEPMYRPNIVNNSGVTKYFAFGTDFHTQGVIDPIWTPAGWGTFITNLNLDGLQQYFWFALPAGGSYANDIAPSGGAGTWYSGMPAWSGHTITVFELDGPAADASGNAITPAPTATPLASIATPGGYVSADLSNVQESNISAILGHQLTVYGGSATDNNGDPVLFPGLTASVSASGLTPGLSVDIWVTADFNYPYFQFLGGGLPTGSIQVGTGTVAADGTLTAYFVLPDTIPYSAGGTAYQMVAGVTGDRYWPAGTWDHFVVKAPPTPATMTTSGTGTSSVTVGATTASVSFSDPSASGTTTVTPTPTGPAPSNFQLAANPPLYYQFSTTVTTGGTATVCISYDPSVLTTPPDLYHFDTSTLTWVDITTSHASGQVCGQTTSFSPFTLGYPDLPFRGFLPPVRSGVNLVKAGQAVPVSFSLGGARGMSVVASAQFRPLATTSNPGGTPIATITAGNSGLQYDAKSDTYTYVWKTSSAWAGQSGDFVLTLSDGSVHTFAVAFKR